MENYIKFTVQFERYGPDHWNSTKLSFIEEHILLHISMPYTPYSELSSGATVAYRASDFVVPSPIGRCCVTTVGKLSTLTCSSPSSVILHRCNSRGGNGRLWMKCVLPPITPGASPLPAQDQWNGDEEHRTLASTSCMQLWQDDRANLLFVCLILHFTLIFYLWKEWRQRLQI